MATQRQHDGVPERRRRLMALRAQLRRAFGAAADRLPARALPTGCPPLDALLVGGGLPRGRLTAVVGPGATGLLHRLAAEATRTGTVAWLDPAGRLEPLAVQAAGADLAEVILSRPPTGVATLRAAAILLRTGAVDLLVVDAPVLEARAARRLAHLARLGPAATVLAGPPAAWLAEEADLVLAVRRAAWQQATWGLQGTVLAVAVARQRGGCEGGRAEAVLPFVRPLPPVAGLAAGRPGAGVAERARHGAG